MSSSVEVKSKRSGRVYEIRELSSLQSSDAFEIVGSPMATIHARMAMCIVAIDGKPVSPMITNKATLRKVLQGIPESDLDAIKFAYDKAFGLTEEDLGNESGADDSPANSSPSSESLPGSAD